jgi:TPR repeat protein
MNLPNNCSLYRLQRSGLLAVLLSLLASGPALAGQCRASVRPLLLATQADPGQLAQVRELCSAEADAGDPQATYQLALLALGVAGTFEPDKALPLISDAASRGVSEAQYWLAWQYEAGPLLPHDSVLALDWYQRAAALNHRLALARLADAYEHGELGMPVDARKAGEFRARQSRCMKKSGA